MNEEELNFIKKCVIKRLYIDKTFKLFNKKYYRSWSAIVVNYKRIADELKIKGYGCKCGCGKITKPGDRYIFGHSGHDKKSCYKRTKSMKKNESGIYGNNHPMKNLEVVKKQQKTMKDKKLGIYGNNHPGLNHPEIIAKAQATMKKNKIGIYAINHPGHTLEARAKAHITMKKNKVGFYANNHPGNTSEVRKKAQITMKKNGTNPLKNRGVNGMIRTKEELIVEHLLKPLGFKSEIVFGTGYRGIEKYNCNRFVADFYNKKYKLVIELDGSSHLMKGVKERDKRKDKFFNDNNIKIMRFNICEKFEPIKIIEVIKNEIR